MPTVTHPRGPARLVGFSAQLVAIREAIEQFSGLDTPVLITGETGTGKELVAAAIHEVSGRSDEPFLAVNCGAIPDSLLESELFGHAKGAFTGAEKARRGLFQDAGAGTILLDEIGEVSSRLQVALLRVLETGEVRPVGSNRKRKLECRVLAATNAPLEQLAEEGGFRSDLLYRLGRLRLHIPPLRERSEDVAPLIHHFLNLDRTDGKLGVMSDALLGELRRRPWPGNVRELRNVIERMRLLSSEPLAYDISHLNTAVGSDMSKARGTGVNNHPAAEGAVAEPAPVGLPGAAAVREERPMMRQLDRLRLLFAKHGRLTRKEVIRILEVSPVTAAKYIGVLRSEGLVEKIEPSRSPRSHYFRLRRPAAP